MLHILKFKTHDLRQRLKLRLYIIKKILLTNQSILLGLSVVGKKNIMGRMSDIRKNK